MGSSRSLLGPAARAICICSCVYTYEIYLLTSIFLMHIHTFVLQRPSQFFACLCAWLPLYDNCDGTTLTFR